MGIGHHIITIKTMIMGIGHPSPLVRSWLQSASAHAPKNQRNSVKNKLRTHMQTDHEW